MSPLAQLRWRTRAVAAAAALAVWIWTAGQLASQEKFKERNYRVRVAVQHEVTDLVLQPIGAYQIFDAAGRPAGQLRSGSVCFVQITRGRTAGLVWRIVVGELDPHQAQQAIDQALRVRDRYRQPVKVIRFPARENQDERILVTLGEFRSAQAARDYARTLTEEQVSHIYEERAPAVAGEVRLIDSDGRRLAGDERMLRLTPVDPSRSTLTLAAIEGRWSPDLLARARRYRGDLELRINEQGSLTAVNELWIEWYLYSVVAAEMGGDAPPEALKAQAVAARSEAIAKITRGIAPSSFFDFFDNAMAQVYPGVGAETAASRAAVDATRGQLLVADGRPCDAVYSHSCGGLVCSAKEMWDGDNDGYMTTMLDRLASGEPPDLSGFDAAMQFVSRPVDALCNPNQPGFPRYAREGFRWTVRRTAEELTRALDPSYHLGRIVDVIVERRTAAGRVRRVRIVGERAQVTLTREMEIRNGLGGLKSTFFAVEKERDDQGRLARVVIRGAGFGHGVGMCQMGAYMMALRGYNYRQILGHYYKGVMIRVLYR